MKVMFVCLKTVLGRKQVGFDRSFGHKMVGCKVRKYSGLSSVLPYRSLKIPALSLEYYDRCPGCLDQLQLIHPFIQQIFTRSQTLCSLPKV